MKEYFMPLRTDLMDKKVLIAAPFYEWKDYCTNSYFENIKNLKWENKSYYFVDNSKDEKFLRTTKKFVKDKFGFSPVWDRTPHVSPGRKNQLFSLNKIREYFLNNDFDYLLMVEVDLFPHPYIIPLLMRWDKPVVGAVYRLKFKNFSVPCITTDAQNLNFGNFGSNFMREDLIDGSLREVNGGIGLGCVLIKREVLEKIKFRSGSLHADTYFHEDCDKFGFKRYVDTSQVVLHDPHGHQDF